MANTKLFYLRLLVLAGKNDPFICVPHPQLPDGVTISHIIDQLIVTETDGNRKPKPLQQILSEPESLKLFSSLGPDLNIVCYAFNFKKTDGTLNNNVELLNEFNNRIYNAFSYEKDEHYNYQIVLSNTEFGPVYGKVFLDDYAKRLGVHRGESGFLVLRSVEMDPFVDSTTKGSFFDVFLSALKERIILEADLINKS
jgi:hypothetical protein